MAESNSNFIINELEIENSGLLQNIQILPEPIGVAQTYIDVYQTPSEILDKTAEIYILINQINQKKQQIVNLCASGIGTFSSGFAQPSCSLEPNVENLNSNVISETGIIPSQTTQFGLVSITTPQIAFGIVREDSVRIQFYSKLEDQSAFDDNALGDVSYPVLKNQNSSLAGKGKDTILFVNAVYSDGSVPICVWNDQGSWSTQWNGDDNVIGTYYKPVGINTLCVGLASSITQLENEIAELRNEFPQYLTPIKGFKNKKYGYQLRVWGYKRTQVTAQEQIDINNTMINVLNNPPFSP
jgi:hypothetical protein